jgi:methoxymalonate biosynthesis acyl carrier protein
MHDHASLQHGIISIFEQKLNVIVLSPTDDLFASGSLDSLLFAEFLSQLEVAYEIPIHLEDFELENFQSVDRIAAFVAQRLGQQAARPGLLNCAGGS